MKVIAVYNVKGGVGKSTLAANLAWASAHWSARRTLLWDLDPQGGGGYLLGIDRRVGAEALNVFSKGAAPESLVVPTRFDRLDVLPADHSLHGLDSLFAGMGKKRRLAKLTQSLEERYDRIILDCPPVLNALSGQIVRAADAIVVPLTASPLARRGLQDVLDELRRNHPGHAPVLPVFSMYDGRRKLHSEAHRAEPDWPIVPMASVMEKMAVLRQPVGAYASSSPAAAAIRSLWTGIERRLSVAAR
jgi:cellulose biosynthesis protein BcsQ